MAEIRWRRALVALAGLALATTGCSGSFSFSIGGQSPTEAAVDLIEGTEMAQRLQIDPIVDATCIEPDATEVGSIFACSGMSAGKLVKFDVEIESDDRIFAGPTNVIPAEDVPSYAESAVQLINNNNGDNADLPVDAIDCGTKTVILDANDSMACRLTFPSTGEEIAADITVTDTSLGTFSIDLGERGS